MFRTGRTRADTAAASTAHFRLFCGVKIGCKSHMRHMQVSQQAQILLLTLRKDRESVKFVTHANTTLRIIRTDCMWVCVLSARSPKNWYRLSALLFNLSTVTAVRIYRRQGRTRNGIISPRGGLLSAKEKSYWVWLISCRFLTRNVLANWFALLII